MTSIQKKSNIMSVYQKTKKKNRDFETYIGNNSFRYAEEYPKKET